MHGCYRFHSTRPAPWKRISVAMSVDGQAKGGANFRRTTRRWFGVWLWRSGNAGKIARPCHTTSASFRGTAQDLGRLPCVMPRGSIRRPVSQLSGNLLDHELPSVERDRVAGALALQLGIDRCLGGDAHDLVAVAQKLACRHGNNEKSSA